MRGEVEGRDGLRGAVWKLEEWKSWEVDLPIIWINCDGCHCVYSFCVLYA